MRPLLTALLVACTGGPPDTDAGTDTDGSVDADTDVDTSAGCPYPAATEPMALNEVIAPYSWPEARLADGRTLPLDLAQAHCDTDPSYDWSPHDYMLFVSVPAW